MKFYDALNPYNQNDMIETRYAAYSYVQFIMGKDYQDHGRANHPSWLTGTSAIYFCGNQLHSWCSHRL
ncbi:hypothetical protein O9929_07915 [Vibrio lentus]|nr:hypothetical protein [Vibrio lentus]